MSEKQTNSKFWDNILLIAGCLLATIGFHWATLEEFPVVFSNFSNLVLLLIDSGIFYLTYKIVEQAFSKIPRCTKSKILLFVLSLIPGYGIIVFYRWIVLLIKLWILLQGD